MAESLSITIADDHFEDVAEALVDAADEAIAEAAREVAALASKRAPRASGALAESYYWAAGGRSDYSERASAASSANPRAVIVPQETPPAGEAIVASAVEHAVHVEYGTTRMPARPVLTEAFEEAAEAAIDRAMQRMAEKL